MVEPQNISIITIDELLSCALKYKHENYRLVQISATRLDVGFELTYTFAKDYYMEAVRLIIEDDDEVVSISDIYSPAFLYENEIKDLFGVKITMISLDYDGNLYRMKHKTPFN